MNKKSGISILSLIITIIVIIIITSITLYNGVDALESAREKNAKDTLKVICGTITRDDSFLILNSSGERELSEDDYLYMDLKGYYDEDVKVVVKKTETMDAGKKSIKYDLTYKKEGSSKVYNFSYTYDDVKESTNYNVVFDVKNGVNMPLVLKEMTPLKKNGVENVEDIYEDSWYSYKRETANFAKVEYDGKIYVWIPRFAYKIQEFYDGNIYPEVPNTAIDIVFLKEDTDYMSNGERIPVGYKVHPAFSNENAEFAGLWYEQTPSHLISNLSFGSIIPTVEKSEENVTSVVHMMSNAEVGAAIYLMYSYRCFEQIELEKDEYVAAMVESSGPYNENFVTIYEKDENDNTLIGDAINETPWGRILSNYPTITAPYMIRKFGSSLFDYTNTNGDAEAQSRSVIAIY